MGKTNELSFLISTKKKIEDNFQVRCQNNFICFSPGILLFMLDRQPKIYYPQISPQITMGFRDLIPNDNKQVCVGAQLFLLEDMTIKKIGKDIVIYTELRSALSYRELKIIKMDHRPKVLHATTPYDGYTFLITFHMGTLTRSIVVPKCASLSITAMKEHTGSDCMFLGALNNPHPLLFLHNNGSVSVHCITPQTEEAEEAIYYKREGQVYEQVLNTKVHRVYATPFRRHYVVLYQIDNVFKFSNNISTESQLLDYIVFPDLQLRLPFNQIVLDVVWSKGGELGCVICLDKVYFINEELKQMQCTNVDGYIIQGFFVGYTLIVVTRLDVQYIDVVHPSVQLYCLDNPMSKYLIAGVLVDRIVGVEKALQQQSKKEQTQVKCRYFNLLQPLLMGYISYSRKVNQPIDALVIKRLIEVYALQYPPSQHLLRLFNRNHLSSFTDHFLERYPHYGEGIRAETLNCTLQIEKYITKETWSTHKDTILRLYLAINKDSVDKETKALRQEQLATIVSQQTLQLVLQEKAPQHGLSIANNFGEQGMIQVHYEIVPKVVKMQLLPFKAENVGEWIGVFPLYLESKEYTAEGTKQQDEEEGEEDDYTYLVVYYRCDEGKGQSVEDLSNYGNQGEISFPLASSAEKQGNKKDIAVDIWKLIENQPMEVEDNWGKKCPPQYSLCECSIVRNKTIACRKKIKQFTVTMWVKCNAAKIELFCIGDFTLGVKKGIFFIVTAKGQCTFPTNTENPMQYQKWVHIAAIYTENTMQIFINGRLHSSYNIILQVSKDSLKIMGNGEFTQFRLWNKSMKIQEVRDTMHTPLGIVAEKRKKLRMKIKEKKASNENSLPMHFGF